MTGLQPVRILVVDDVAAWRDQIRAILAPRQGWNIVGEASDGEEAVQKATELRADIILLDIGMPVLNGIGAAKIIRQRCPKSKILFVTQDGDRDIKEEALRAGAVGYVLKANAANELLDTITRVLELADISDFQKHPRFFAP